MLDSLKEVLKSASTLPIHRVRGWSPGRDRVRVSCSQSVTRKWEHTVETGVFVSWDSGLHPGPKL